MSLHGRRLLVIGVVLVSLVLPASALAHKRPTQHPTTDPTTLALRLGEEYWGSTPCEGNVTVTASHTVPTTLEIGPWDKALTEGTTAVVAAWTSFDTPIGPNDYSASPATFTNCVITINSTAWPNWLEDDTNFQEYCALVSHEIGHLFGHPDAGQTNPESIEYPVIGFTNVNSVPQCQHVNLWYGRQHFVSY
jgi:hypothetical protein